MEPAFNKIQKLRISQRFLSRDQFKPKQIICCCFFIENDQAEHRFHLFDPILRQDKISMKKIKKHSHKGMSHSNSDLSIGRFSQKSILPTQGKAMVSTRNLSSMNLLDQSDTRHAKKVQHGKITFAYSSKINPQYPHKRTLQSYQSQTLLNRNSSLMNAKSSHDILSQPIIEENIQNQFNNVLGFGESQRQEVKCGEPFNFSNKKGEQLPKSTNKVPNLSHFSFGQHQKQQFLHKFLNYRLQNGMNTSIRNERIDLQHSIKDFIEQKQSKSSKSSGAVFAKGTFNAKNLKSLTRGRNVMFQYKSQSSISLQSSQSLVIQSFQNVMKKKEGDRRFN